MKAIKIYNDKTMTVREIAVDGYYILRRDFVRYMDNEKDLALKIRRRTKDPYWSRTVFGTRVYSFPSDQCYPVDLLEV